MSNIAEVKIQFNLDAFRVVGISHPPDLGITMAILQDALFVMHTRRAQAEGEGIKKGDGPSPIIQPGMLPFNPRKPS